MGPPLFQRGVIEKRIRLRVQNLVREERRFRRVAGYQRDFAAVDTLEDRRQSVEVHRLLEAIADGLRNQRVIRDFPVSRNVLETGRRVGKRRREQVVGQHPLQLWRNLLAAAAARNRERDGRIPAPPGLEHRGIQERLHQHVAGGVGMQVAEDVGQRKGMLRTEREQNRVFGSRRLQLEVELPAESLSQRKTPGLVDPAAERRVQHELHSAGLVKEPLQHQCLLRRDDAKRAAPLGKVIDHLIDGAGSQSCLAGEPLGGLLAGRSKMCVDRGAKIAHGARQLIASRRRFAKPEWNVRWNPLRVSHADRPRRHLQHAPRRIA